MKPNFKKTLIWFAVFIVFTVLVMFVDVQPAGHPEGVDVNIGLASINIPVFEGLYKALGVSACTAFYKISQFCGLIAIAVCVCMGLSGASQLFKRKGLHFVDSKIIAMGIYYIIVIAFYALFTKVGINYRPVIVDAVVLEPSYPSSHTVLALTVVIALIKFTENFIYEERKAQILYRVVSWAFVVITIVTRLLSCVHWISDIIGSLILSMALVELYEPIVAIVTGIHDKREEKRLKSK